MISSAITIMTDPFALFDSDSDDDHEKGPHRRSQENGLLSFHAGTEISLLKYIQATAATTPSLVRQAMDAYCHHRHWMMHAGPEKARVLESFLQQCLEAYAHQTTFCLVELGTYCGYSALLWVQLLTAFQIKHADFRFTIYSIDINAQHQEIAQKLLHQAGCEEAVQMVLLQEGETLVDALPLSSIDFLFLDHDKDFYLRDFQALETSGLIGKGTHIAADNVVFFHLQAYRDHVQRVCSSTQLVMGLLEYSQQGDSAEDGIGTWQNLEGHVLIRFQELSVY